LLRNGNAEVQDRPEDRHYIQLAQTQIADIETTVDTSANVAIGSLFITGVLAALFRFRGWFRKSFGDSRQSLTHGR
jgi:hypothetical protein